MQYRFKIIHEGEDPIYTDWRDESPPARIAHLAEVHNQYPLASVGTEFQGAPSTQYAWLGCPFTDKEASDRFATEMQAAGYKVRQRDGICIGIGGPKDALEDMKRRVHSALEQH